MWSWIKRSFAPEPAKENNPSRDRLDQTLEQVEIKQPPSQIQPVFSKQSIQSLPQRIHIEFFLYDAKNDGSPMYTEEDLHRYPMMGFTLHFLEQSPRPEWVSWVLTGLEETLASMKISSHRLNEPHLYSLFVDLKLYPQTEVKKSIYLLFQQLYQWYCSGQDRVSLRVHIGGDELYQELLETHLEAV